MLATDIIVKPLITEKATHASGEHNRHTFHVDRRADKGQIKRAVEELYNVRVQSVATINRKGQARRNKFGYWKTKDVKRAIVKIHPDDRIELF
jgi:large subunit ribosomal protein L23